MSEYVNVRRIPILSMEDEEWYVAEEKGSFEPPSLYNGHPLRADKVAHFDAQDRLCRTENDSYANIPFKAIEALLEAHATWKRTIDAEKTQAIEAAKQRLAAARLEHAAAVATKQELEQRPDAQAHVLATANTERLRQEVSRLDYDLRAGKLMS